MSDVAAQIAREAKGLQVGLKELLKTHDVLDKEIEIQRKNLRRQYLRLLFVHPYAKESRDAETHLWMQTSYSLISIYKHRIASLDRAIQNPPRQPQNAQPQRVVEYRKLLQRFRQFLAEEERFWTQLIVRFRRNFAVDAAQPALTALGIVADEETPPSNADAAPRRNQYQFPPESDTPEATQLATTTSQRESRLAILSKALVCLGDIARYKEQYNEAGGRPRAGYEDGPPAAAAGKISRGRRGGAPPVASPVLLPRMRDYSRARLCYEQARSLVPHDGNPSHQLAILCSYEKDMFNSLAHYYRALCVRQPYDTASENMGTVLSRALDQWKSRRAKREEEAQVDAGSLPPRLRVEAIKEKIIVLHAQWRVGVRDDEGLAEKILQDFNILVSERILPLDMISKVVVLSQGALWKHRMVRQPSNGEKKPQSSSTESRIASHLLDLHSVLLHIATHELSEVLSSDILKEDATQIDLAQRIPAVFRRVIPALRMAGKWIRANTRYLSQAAGLTIDSTRHRGRGREGKQGSHKEKLSPVIVIAGLEAFWHDYVKYANILMTVFPVDRLHPLTSALEEDIEMVGFLPLRKYMIGDGRPVISSSGQSKLDRRGQPPLEDATLGLHPNEEQLMRISDMLVDAKAVANDENTPLVLRDGLLEYVKQPAVVQREPSQSSPDTKVAASLPDIAAQDERLGPISDIEDDNVTIATRTDDDLVGDAFRVALGAFEAEDDDDYEEILWNPTPMRSPQHVPSAANELTTPPRLSPTSPKSPISLPFSPHKEKPLPIPQGLEHNIVPPAAPLGPSASTGVTAAELLSNMRGSQRLRAPSSASASYHHVRMPSAPTAPLSFGPNGPVSSIWSDDHSRHASAGAKLPGSTITSSPFHSADPQISVRNQISGYTQGPWLNTPPSQASTAPFLPSSSATMYNSHQLAAPYNLNVTHNIPAGQSRVPSESVFLPRSQLYQTQSTSHRFNSLNSPLPIGDQLNVPSRGLNSISPSVYQDTIYSASPSAAFAPRDAHDQYPHNLPPRSVNVDRTFTAPFISSSSVWGHPG